MVSRYATSHNFLPFVAYIRKEYLGAIMPINVQSKESAAIIGRARSLMNQWGITHSFLATELGVSRQYVWQVLNGRIPLSRTKAHTISKTIETIITKEAHLTSFGARLRAARLSAGLTLKQVASMIGYSWVGVERWEKDVCLPKPGVLWHLFSLYGVHDGRGSAISPEHRMMKQAS
jgi:transcriptional regulator with XRE-family HTH domain